MSRKVQLILFLFAVISFHACLEEIEFEPPSQFQDLIVVQGKIVKGSPSSIELSLQNIFDFSFSQSSFFNARDVFVVNSKGQRLMVPLTSTGNYQLDIESQSEFEVEYGESYGVEINLLDGRSFRSDLETLLPVPEMISIEHQLVEREVENEDGVLVSAPWVEYKVSSNLIAEENNKRTNVRWIIESTYKQSDLIAKDQCYVKRFENPSRLFLFSTLDNTRTTVDNEPVLEQVVSRIMVEGQYVTVIQESLDDRSFEYWNQINELSTNSGTFYEPPPGQILTNFESTNDSKGEIFGFFYATEQDSLHAFVDSNFVDFYTAICPHPDNVPRENMDFGPCDDCCFCLWLDNSTTTKPSFWVD